SLSRFKVCDAEQEADQEKHGQRQCNRYQRAERFRYRTRDPGGHFDRPAPVYEETVQLCGNESSDDTEKHPFRSEYRCRNDTGGILKHLWCKDQESRKGHDTAIYRFKTVGLSQFIPDADDDEQSHYAECCSRCGPQCVLIGGECLFAYQHVQKREVRNDDEYRTEDDQWEGDHETVAQCRQISVVVQLVCNRQQYPFKKAHEFIHN